ncbi:MAG: acetylornithine deacetylase [Myxococcaceae bacterium]
MSVGLEETLRELVAIDSTSSLSNAPMVDYLEARLRKAGFECERHRYTDEAGVAKQNLISRRGRKGKPELALVGHTDCVPYDAAWKEALTLTERDGKLYARGACDTKAYIACALHAVESVQNVERPLLTVFTADEEVGCYGAKKLVEAKLGQARYAIVGEPTSLTPVRANKGYCLAEIEVRGKEGHSAYPETGASAIFRAGRLLERLEAYALGSLRADADPQFSPPYTTVNVGTIQGGRAKNILPGECRFILEWRPIPRQPVDTLPTELTKIINALRATDAGYDVTVKILRADRGVETSPTSPVVKFLEDQSGKQAETVAFGTEAPQLTALGAEAVVFGPGDIRVAHQTGEFVPKAELHRAQEILQQAIRQFCS